MGTVINNVKKSDIRPNKSDLLFGEPIIFEYNGETWSGYCQGWRMSGEQVMVKTDLMETWYRVDVPIENVWRVWDSRDDKIAAIKALLEELYHGYVDSEPNYDIEPLEPFTNWLHRVKKLLGKDGGE